MELPVSQKPDTNVGLDNSAFEMPNPSSRLGAGDEDENNVRHRGGSAGSNLRKVSFDHNVHEDDVKNTEGNILTKSIIGARSGLYNLVVGNKGLVRVIGILLVFLLYNGYVVTAVAYNVRHELPIAWCDGLGCLIVLTALLYWSFFYYVILKGYCGPWLSKVVLKPLSRLHSTIFSAWYVGTGLTVLLLAGVVTFIIIDCWGEPRRLVSACGVLVIVFVGTLLSSHPGHIIWRQVFSGLGLQFVFALAVLRWEGGRSFLECLSSKITTFLTYADSGSSFIYNFVASGELTINNATMPELIGAVLSIPTTFAFTSLSVIFFFSFVVQLLYHIGAMLWVVRKVGWLLQVLLGTSAAESMNAAANIFLGQTEAPLLIRPFMDDLTKSELHAVMTGGFATIAGTVMAAYISFGVKAESLFSASVMAAPCALALSKLIYPETEVSKTTAEKIKNAETKSEGNALDAATQGAIQGITLVGCIVANLIAFISFVTFLNSIFGWFGTLVGVPQLSFEWILSKLFIPVALCIGIDPAEAEDVALLLGLKTVVNEFVAYGRLQGMNLSERSRRISEYALCGFANLSSVGIQLGGLGGMAPNRRADLSEVVWRALFTGTVASLLNACVAGTLMSFDQTIPSAPDNSNNDTILFGMS